MVSAELVAHLMRHIIDVIRVSRRLRQTCDAAGLLHTANHAQERDATATCRCYVSDVVIQWSNQSVDGGLVSCQHGDSLIVNIRISRGVEDNEIVVCN